MNIKKLIKNNKGWIIISALALAVFSMIKEPVFFDNFGVPIFIFLLASSLYMVLKKKYPEWILWLIVIISSAGLIVDGIQILK